jgi:hypothetical protein
VPFAEIGLLAEIFAPFGGKKAKAPNPTISRTAIKFQSCGINGQAVDNVGAGVVVMIKAVAGACRPC